MSDYQELSERMYGEVVNLIRVMANDIANPNYWQLVYDEVMAELSWKMAEVVWEYSDKPFDELKKLVIVSLRNHKATLTRRCYGTHRALEIGALDIDDVEDERGVVDFHLNEFLDGLEDVDAKALICEILRPSIRTRFFIRLEIFRKGAVHDKNGWTMSVTPLMMERAMGWNAARLSHAWDKVTEYLDR